MTFSEHEVQCAVLNRYSIDRVGMSRVSRERQLLRQAIIMALVLFFIHSQSVHQHDVVVVVDPGKC